MNDPEDLDPPDRVCPYCDEPIGCDGLCDCEPEPDDE